MFITEENSHYFGQPGAVIDIGGGEYTESLKDMTEDEFLQAPEGHPRSLPTGLFYNTPGLKRWGDITRLPEYRQTQDEIDLLEHNKDEIVRHIDDGCMLVDMGSGDTRKVLPLLQHIEYRKRRVFYFALDLSDAALRHTMKELSNSFQYVQCFGLWGTFADGLEWLKSQESPKCIMSLGSMFGNDEFHLAVARLSEWTDAMGPGDYMLLGLDACRDQAELWSSYHDPNLVWEDFIRNGLRYSNEVLEHSWYREEDWSISGRIDRSSDVVHRFSIVAKKDVVCPELGLSFAANDSVEFFEAWKYGPERMKNQFKLAGFKELTKWQSPGGRPFYEYLLTPAPVKL